jgi:hypothetical protein
MRSFRTLVLALALLSGTAGAQYVATTQAISGYPSLTNPQSITLTAQNSVSDRGRATVALPFTFQFYNRQFTSLIVTANGMAFFVPSTSPTEDFPSNVAIPSTIEPNGVLAPFWDDLDGNNGTSAIRQQVVNGPNGQGLAIEWKDWNRRFGMYTLTFQIRLWENGVIEYFYGTMQGSGVAIAATIGIEAPSGAQGTNALLASSCVNRTDPRNPVVSYAHCDLGSFDPMGTGSPITYVRFGPPPGFDLQPSRLSVTNIAQAGNDLQISTEVSMRNFGTLTSPAFNYRLYLSEDTLFDSPSADAGVADVEIVTGALPPGPFSLPPNGTVTNSVTGVAPRPISGNFYVLVVVNESNAMAETNMANNVLATSTPFFAGIDLVAESVSGPASAGPGDSVTISYSLTNQGFDPAGVVPLKVLLSADTVFSMDDREVYSGTRAVQGGENVVAQVTFTLPPTVPADDYYLLLQIDSAPAAGSVVEVSDSNNLVFSRSRVQVRQADLVMDGIRVARPLVPFETATAAFFGEPIRVEATVRNQGGASAPSVSVVFFLSDNETLNGLSDPFVCEEGPFALAPGATRVIGKTCTVPTRSVANQLLTRGPYFFFAAAVAAGLAETNPNNNFAKAEPVTVRGPAPNLVPINLRGPTRVGVGEVFAVTRTITNNGNRPSPTTKYRYVLSANTIITTDDPVLPIVTMMGEGNDGTVRLAVDQQDTVTELVRIPALLSPATWTLGILIDPENLVDEVDKADNGLPGPQVVVVPQTLGLAPAFLPDAIVNQPYFAELSAAGTTDAATFVVKNPAELPPGITVSMGGEIRGTPQITGAYAFTVVVRTANRMIEVRRGLKVSRSTASLVLNTPVLPPPARLLPYDFQLGTQGGVGPYRYLVTSGVLPSGLVLSEGGHLTGAPDGALGTANSITLSVIDSVGNSDSRAYVMTVVDASPFRITNASLPDGIFGQQYLVDIVAQNAGSAPVSRPVRWTVLEGDLPPGLVLEETVTERIILSGSPTNSGVFRFRIEATDAQGRSDSVTYTVFVSGSGVNITGDLPLSLDHGASVNVQLNPSSNVDRARFFILDGALPPGLTLSDRGLVSGTVAVDAPYRSFTMNIGYGASLERLVTMRAFRIDVEAPGTARRSGCAATGDVGLSSLLLLLGVLARRRRVTSVLW